MTHTIQEGGERPGILREGFTPLFCVWRLAPKSPPFGGGVARAALQPHCFGENNAPSAMLGIRFSRNGDIPRRSGPCYGSEALELGRPRER
jgi:hypothetical protein